MKLSNKQNKELRHAYYKMLFISTIFYLIIALCIISDSKDKHVFLIVVLIGYCINLGILITQLVKTYINK